MKININNAEAFFLDYYEGTLSEQEVAEMFAFLKANPALRETFESFADVSVNTDEVGSPDFSFLKKEIPVAADEHEQAEIWMADAVDGSISDEDRANLEKYFVTYPDKRAELALFEKTILRADENEKFEGLSGLKKTVTVHEGNFDDFAVACIEGTITSEEQELLNMFMSVSPEFKTQFENYKKTVSAADESIRFEGKSSLKKSQVVVNASNIDEFLIAKMEGELAPHQEQAVDAFVAAHPEYRIDLDLLANAKLQPDTSLVFDAKEKLKRGVLLINDENFEQHAISASEGLLNGEELKAFNAFVNANPKHRKTVALYAATRLQFDANIVYEDKAGLKRKEREGIVWWSVSMRVAAAIVVIILAVYFWVKSGSNVDDVQNGNTIANNESVNPQTPLNPLTNDTAGENASNGSGLASTTDPKNNSKEITQPVVSLPGEHGNNKGNPTRPLETGFVPATIIVNSLPNPANDAVNFSDALYATLFNETTEENPSEYLSPGQTAMRWMKAKLDGPDARMAENKKRIDGTGRVQPEDPNVDGTDLAESALNRVGDATGGNVNMERKADGTWLHLWKYSVRVSQNK